jgi:Domain of unknown function (DUF4389)
VSYPVTFEVDYLERRNRLTTFFRLLLTIPVAIVLYVFGIVAGIAIVIAWFAIVITGRYPKGLYDFVADFNRFVARVMINLLLEVGAFAAWFVILFTGKMPRGLFDLMVLANSYTARSDAYLFLLTETYPPFQDETTRGAGTPGPTMPEAPPPPEAAARPQAPPVPPPPPEAPPLS